MDPRIRRQPARHAPERDDRVGIRRGLGIARSQEGQQQVDGDRPAGKPACGGDLNRDRRAYARDRAETPGLRHSRGEFMPRDAPHPRLNDRRFETTHIEGRRHRRAAA